MPKRKSESDDFGKLLKKFKKLERKFNRRCRNRNEFSDAEYEEREHSVSHEAYEVAENNVAGLLDGVNTFSEAEPGEDRGDESTMEPIAELTASAATASAVTAMSAQPSTSAAIIMPQVSEESGPTEIILANDILEILGEDPTISNSYGDEIHKDLAVRLEHVATHGLNKELRKELTEKYLLPSNCKLVNAPALNAEIKAAISEMTAKRDKNIEQRQKQVAIAISSLGQAINKIISSDNSDAALVKMLMDTERILCDSQHNDSVIRRNFILSTMKKDMRDQLQNTRPDNLLFGQNLTETIKTAKAINKSGAELKTPLPKPQHANMVNKKHPAAAGPSKNLNWKGPYPARKQQNYPKTKEPPPSRKQQSSSSKHSQHQRRRDRR